MVPGEVGEDRAQEARSRDALQGHPVRRDLQHGVLDPGIEHLSQSTLHLRRLGGGTRGGTPLAPKKNLGRGHEAALLGGMGSSDDRVQGVGGRGLAVGSGDTIDRHLRRRFPKHSACQRRERRPGIWHDDGGHARGQPAFCHDERRPTPQGLRDELGAIAPEARNRHEGEAGLDETRVVGHADDAFHPQRGLSTQYPSQLCA